MQCERLTKLAKSWFAHVRDETMAPARMISFMEQHADECDICYKDPDLKDEIAKIKELILPESKIPKAVRAKEEEVEEEEAEDHDNDNEDDEDDDHDDEESEDLIVDGDLDDDDLI